MNFFTKFEFEKTKENKAFQFYTFAKEHDILLFKFELVG